MDLQESSMAVEGGRCPAVHYEPHREVRETLEIL